MKTHELAKELDGLARAIRSLTWEASTEFAAALNLDGRGIAAKPALTIAAVAGALAAVTRKPAVSVELRKDVYQRRCERNGTLFAERLEAAVKAGSPAPAGTRFAPRFTRLPPGMQSIYDATPRGKTAINADVSGWQDAARYVLARIVPHYSRDAIDRYAHGVLDGAGFDAIYDLKDVIGGAVDAWLDDNTVIHCEMTAGSVTRVLGVDPTPFRVLWQQAAQNPDPLGILKMNTSISRGKVAS